jgi:hypothetical protein
MSCVQEVDLALVRNLAKETADQGSFARTIFPNDGG